MITVYLGFVATLEWSLFECAKVRLLGRLCQSAVAEGKIRRRTMAEGSRWILRTFGKQKKELSIIIFMFFFTVYAL